MHYLNEHELVSRPCHRKNLQAQVSLRRFGAAIVELLEKRF